MSTIVNDVLDPARLAARAGSTFGERAVPQTDRLEVEDDDEPTPVKIDRMVAENRARTPQAAAEMRRTPRLSLAELADLDQEEIARRLSKIRRDDRTPIEQALDLIDLPRNAVMQAVAPGLARRARERGETGTFGLGKVYASDVLNEMGVENRVVRSLVGFGGDVLLDPLTYVGPAGWGAMLAGKAGSVGVRAAGKKAIKSAIADAAAGRAVRDPALRKYFATKGLAKTADETAAQAYARIEKAVRGGVDEGAVHKAFIPFGADRQYTGGTLVDDLFSPVKSDASLAAAEFFERYGRGTRGFGPVGGSEIAHIPFTDISLRVRPFSQEARRATQTHRLAKLRDSDLREAFLEDVRGGPIVAARHAIGERTDDALDLRRRMHEESMRYEAMKKSATRPPDPPPPDEPPAGAPVTPGPGTPPGTPGAADELNMSPDAMADRSAAELRDALNKADAGAWNLGGSSVAEGSGGEQGGLFGSQPAPAPTPAATPGVDPSKDPFAGGVPTPERMIGESDEAYKQRLAQHKKWDAAAKNTGLLFQSADPPPGSPAALIDMEHSAFQQQETARLEGIVSAARAAFQQAEQAMESGRALSAVPTPANVREELALQEALIDAKVELDRAESVLQQATLARTLSKSMAEMDDLIDQVALIGERDIAEDLLYLFREDPAFADQYVEMLQNGVYTAGMQVDVLRGALSTALTKPETVLVERAKQLIGTGDSWIAASLFAPVARMLGKDGSEDSQLVQTLWGIDRAFRTLGIRGGTMNRMLARIKALYRHAAMEGARVEDAINRDLAAVLKTAGKSDQLAAAGQLVYARMHTLRGQGENYHFWKFDPAGPVYDEATGQIVNRSGLAQLLHDAQEGSGLLTDQAVREAVDRVAGEQLEYLRSLGDAEVEDLVLGARLAGYVPITTTKDFTDAVRLQKEGYGATGNLRPRDRGKEPFQKGPRLTMQTRFVDPELLGKDGKPQWRRFFEGDRYLTEMSPEKIAHTMARRYQGNETAIAARTAEKLEAREAILRYDELTKQDAAFAEKYPMRPTDGIELNELFAEGRFDYLTGSNPAPENFIETNAAMVMANRTMQHQRARAARLFKDLYRESFTVDPVLLHNVAGSGVEVAGEVKKLANGKPFRVLAPQQTRVGGHAPTVLIDGERYRLLDSSVRADASDHPVLRGLFGGEQLDGRLFQHQFADAIEDLALALRPERAEQIIKVYDTFQSAWKMLTLTSPSWPIFNFVGNITLAVMGGANPLSMARHALDAGRVVTRQANREALADLRITIRGQEVPGDILLALARDRGVINNTLSLEFAGAAARADKSLLQIPDRLMRRYLSPWFRANQMADDTVRLAAFIAHLEDGADATTAASKVLRSMFDYADFTVIEERLFRRLFPFYSWMRSNLAYQMAMMLERPGYANLAPKLKRAIEEAAAGDDRVPENLRPSWMRESLAAQIGSDPQSRFALMLGGNILPQSDMMRILTPMFGVDGSMRFFHFIGSSISPIIIKPAELAFGRELFSGREIGGDLGIGQFTSSIFRPYSEYGPVGLAAAGAGAVAGGMLGGTPGAVAGGVLGAQASVAAGGLGGRVGRSADRSIPLAVSRSLVGGRVQAFDADRLDTTVAREIRDIEGRIRGRIRAAEREGDEDESLQARAELLALYRDLVQRGQEESVPKWARQFLGRAAAQPIAVAG